VLERAGLVRRERAGRVSRCELDASAMREAAEWIEYYRPFCPEGKVHIAIGEYREVERPTLLAFTSQFFDCSIARCSARSMSTRQTIELYFDRLRAKADWEGLLADNVVFTSFTMPNRQVSGKDAFIRGTKGFYSMIRRVEVRQVIVDGSAACALTRYDLQPPNGGAVFQSDVAEVFSVSNDKIDSLGIYFDPTPFPK